MEGRHWMSGAEACMELTAHTSAQQVGPGPSLAGQLATGERETALKERGATCRAAIQWWWNGKAGLGGEAEGFGLGEGLIGLGERGGIGGAWCGGGE